MDKDDTNLGYMIHLDGLRAFAVIAVIIEHWASGLPGMLREMAELFDLGGLGVECFFVLSGYLITGILLRSKNEPFNRAIGHFYVRRVLRIFPAYYLTLVVAYVLTAEMGEVVSWHALYLSNIYPFFGGSFAPIGGHFWSLSVEEQFYLFWPLIVLTLPLRYITQLAVLCCFLAPLSRSGVWFVMGGPHAAIWSVTTSCLDLLGYGALLAIFRYSNILSEGSGTWRTVMVAGWIAFVAYLGLYLIIRQYSELTYVVLARTCSAMFFGALVLKCAHGFQGVAKYVFGNKLIVFLGVISYGLYIYHMFIPDIYIFILNTLQLDKNIYGIYYIRYPLLLTILLVITLASYLLVERPIRNLRRNFL